MRKIVLPFLCILFTLQAAQAQVNNIVFASGADGYESYRIPALVAFSKQYIVAIAEGRVHHAGDFGDIDIVMKISKDGGASWGPLQKIADAGELQAGNPAPVIDWMDPRFPDGRLFLFYNIGNNHEGEVRKGQGQRTVWYITSSDRGNSWSAPTEITTQVHRPNAPQVNPAWQFKEDWRSYANTPGHGMQIQKGPQAGRIFIAANHSAGDPQPAAKDYQAHGFYSDDHGKTFQLSQTVSYLGSNESTAAEISGGRLMMNSRNQQGDQRARIISISGNGGTNWDTTYVDKQLPDPVNQGSLLTLKWNKRGNTLAFTNAADTQHRDNLTLRISQDDGKNWKKSIVVAKSAPGYKGDWAAYSDIVALGKAHIGVLYEQDNYKSIVFKKIKWK